MSISTYHNRATEKYMYECYTAEEILWKKKRSWTCKIYTFKLTYAKTWSLTKWNKGKIRVTNINIFRNTERKIGRNKVRNEILMKEFWSSKFCSQS